MLDLMVALNKKRRVVREVDIKGVNNITSCCLQHTQSAPSQQHPMTVLSTCPTTDTCFGLAEVLDFFFFCFHGTIPG